MRTYLRGRINSFKPAFRGIFSLIRLEKNAFIHLIATIVVILVSFWLHIALYEWLWIILSITLVWLTELFNTAIEKLCDLINSETHPQIKIIKDLSAGAVLVSALFAVFTALIIFLPRIIS
ncbi:MAG: hypothetical protein BGO78_01565 [Chloroflexi bacterium 44-23]|nr:MAG: hypothetical protein BGO78_01565 [Chloroflexi bacterium 44-23]